MTQTSTTAPVVTDPLLVPAIRRCEERLQREPTSLVFAPLADLYRKVGRTHEAIVLCREGLERYPHYATARLILVKALMDAGALAAALEELQKILEGNPKDAPTHRVAAEIQRRAGRIDAAVHHLEMAIRLEPGDRESRSLLALLQPEGAGLSEASGLGRVLRDDTFITVSFGVVCLEQGLLDEAVHVFTRILRKNSDHLEARDRLEQAVRARLRRKG